MPEPAGETIVLRPLAPLPDLAAVVFVRHKNRAFVTGRGPLAVTAGPGVRRFLKYGALAFTGVGGALTLGAAVAELYLGIQSPPEDLDVGWIAAGLTSLGLGAIYGAILWFQNRRAVAEQRLARDGGLIGAELVATRYWSGGKSGPSLRIDYRFTAPDEQVVNRRQSFSLFDLDRKALPPPGSKLLVLWVDETLFELL
jgi:hypothetical protein